MLPRDVCVTRAQADFKGSLQQRKMHGTLQLVTCITVLVQFDHTGFIKVLLLGVFILPAVGIVIIGYFVQLSIM